jgi:hypothetical protein
MDKNDNTLPVTELELILVEVIPDPPRLKKMTEEKIRREELRNIPLPWGKRKSFPPN